MGDLEKSIAAAIKGCSLDCADWSADAQAHLVNIVLKAVEASLGRVFLRGYYASVERTHDHDR